MSQSNIIHRTQSNRTNNARKVIGVEKASYGQSAEILTAEQPTETTQQQIETVEATTETPIDPRTTKRQEFSMLEKARKLDAEAKSKLQKATELEQAYASKDLDKIAKANGMSTTDYVRWINAKAVGAPTEKTLSPAEQVAENAKNWQEKMDKDMAEVKQMQNANNKQSYINKNILPHIVKDPEKFEFITDKGVDQVADLIYDFMNAHYNSTGGKNGGEELDPVELLTTLEEQYMTEWNKEWQERQTKAAKFKKLQPKTTTAEPSKTPNAEGSPVKTIGAKTSPHPTGKSEAEIFAGINGGELDENVLAQSAPSNLVAGASRGSAPARQVSSFATGGTTPKNSKYSREARLAAMAKSQS